MNNSLGYSNQAQEDHDSELTRRLDVLKGKVAAEEKQEKELIHIYLPTIVSVHDHHGQESNQERHSPRVFVTIGTQTDFGIDFFGSTAFCSQLHPILAHSDWNIMIRFELTVEATRDGRSIQFPVATTLLRSEDLKEICSKRETEDTSLRVPLVISHQDNPGEKDDGPGLATQWKGNRLVAVNFFFAKVRWNNLARHLINRWKSIHTDNKESVFILS